MVAGVGGQVLSSVRLHPTYLWCHKTKTTVVVEKSDCVGLVKVILLGSSFNPHEMNLVVSS